MDTPATIPAPPPPPVYIYLPPPLPSADDQQKKPFAPGPVALGVFFLAVVVYAALGFPQWQRDPMLVLRDMGTFALCLLLATALAWLAWRLDPRRRAGGLVFGFLMSLAILSRVGSAMLDHKLAEQKRSLALARPGPVARTSPAVSDPADRPAIPADGTNAPAAPAATASAELQRVNQVLYQVGRQVETQQDACTRAESAFTAAGEASVVGLNSLADIARRRALLKTCLDANLALTTTLRGLPDAVRGPLRPILGAAGAEQRCAAFYRPDILDLSLQIRQCDHRMLEAMDATLILYANEFTRWHLDAHGTLFFDSGAAVERSRFWVAQAKLALHEKTVLRERLSVLQKSLMAKPPAAR